MVLSREVVGTLPYSGRQQRRQVDVEAMRLADVQLQVLERFWAQRAPELRGRALDCGHFLAEERPAETTAELLAFLTQDP